MVQESQFIVFSMNSMLNGDIPPGVVTVVEAEKHVKIVHRPL